MLHAVTYLSIIQHYCDCDCDGMCVRGTTGIYVWYSGSGMSQSQSIYILLIMCLFLVIKFACCLYDVVAIV